jgi:hypothetical protein
MSLINRLLQRMSGQSRHYRARRHTAYSPFGIQAAQVETLESRRLLSALTVTTAADSGAGSLRAEIAAAKSGDSINFASSLNGRTITLTSGELLIKKGLTIQGPGASQLTVSSYSRVFDVNATQPVVLSGLTIRHGGIFNQTALTISNCSIYSSHATYGGAVDNRGTLTVNGCNITGNSALSGGGIRNLGTLTVTGSTINSNQATYDGAGIYNFGGGKLTISQSTLAHNTAYLDGAGMYNGTSSTATLTNCTLGYNQSLVSGGVGNIAGGGGLYVDFDSTTSLTNCTLSLNRCTEDGGGIAVNSGGILNLTNTIVAGNTGQSYPDIYGAVATADHNLIGNATGSTGIVNGVNGNIVGGNGNPVINADLGPLQNNGGTTQTMALLADSLAIGHADNSRATATDERGRTRLDEAGEMTDIGAFEL